MSPAPSERELERLLSELPRVSASPGFSRRVLAELDAPAGPRRGRGWLLTAAAAAIALAVGLMLMPRARPQPPIGTQSAQTQSAQIQSAQVAGAQTRALEREHRLLMEELEALKASLRDREPAPVLYLGGTEGLDLVLDLEPVWRGETAGIRPAANRDTERPVAAVDRRRGEQR